MYIGVVSERQSSVSNRKPGRILDVLDIFIRKLAVAEDQEKEGSKTGKEVT